MIQTTRRGLITGALATLLAPLDLEPRRRFWPGWTPRFDFMYQNPSMPALQAQIERELSSFVGRRNTADVRREIARRTLQLLDGLRVRQYGLTVISNGLDYVVSVELVREVTLTL